MATDLFYQSHGNAKNRAIVFLHGGPGSNSWAFEASSAYNLVQRGYRVIVYNQRGSCRSPTGQMADYNFDRFTADLRDLITTLGLQSPILIGHSWGGLLSLKYLQRYAGAPLAAGLVMVGTPIDFPEAFYTMLMRIKDIYDDSAPFVLALPVAAQAVHEHGVDLPDLGVPMQSLLDEVKQLLARMFPNGLTPPYHFLGDDIKAVFKHVTNTKIDYHRFWQAQQLIVWLAANHPSECVFKFNEDVRAGFYQSDPYMLDKSYIGLVQQVSSSGMPVHAIYGKSDGLYSARQMQEIEATLPPHHFSYIDSVGHYPFLERNGKFLDILAQHLAAVP